MFTALHFRLVAELRSLEQFTHVLQVCTKEPRSTCLDFAKKVPHALRQDVLIAITEGLSIAECDKIFSSTLLSLLWQLNWAGRDLVRAIMGLPTVREMT